MKRIGPSTLPCGMPLVIFSHSKQDPRYPGLLIQTIKVTVLLEH